MAWTASTGTKTLVIPGTCTMTIASPAVVSFTAHGLSVNDMVVFTTTGALPTGVTAGTTYFVITVVDANSFQFSATKGGAAVNTSGSQSGTHTLTSEFVLSEVTAVATYMAFVDLVNMANVDYIEIGLYDMIDGTNYRQIDRIPRQNAQTSAGLVIYPFPVTSGAKFTLKQTAGTGRAVPYSIRSI